MEPLTEDQMRFVGQCVAEWIELHHVHLKRDPTPGDAYHSALLRRLLSGKKPLPKPPPKRFAYPDYKMGEGEVCDVGEINTWTAPPGREGSFEQETKGYTVCIDQHIGWKWIEKHGPEDAKGIPETGILEYTDGSRYRFWWDTKTYKRLNCANGVLTGGYTEVQERTKFMQLIKEDSNGGTDRDLHAQRQSDG